jgi:DNA-binding transcriptional ArsR family regulator
MVSTDSLARAVGHPLRVRVLAALDDGPCGLDALARRIEADPRTTARHARVLEQAGLVRRDRSGRTTTYDLADPVSFSDDEYAVMPAASQEAAVAAALAHCHTAAAAALESGGFSRSDIHLSRTSLDLTEAQWSELSDELARVLDRIDELKAQEPDADDERVSASAVLMLFERTTAGGDHLPHGDAPFSTLEGLEQAWGLSERLERELGSPSTDWASVVALADELRVLARAAMRDETRAGAPAVPAA